MLLVIMLCIIVGLTLFFNIYIHCFTYEQGFSNINHKAEGLRFFSSVHSTHRNALKDIHAIHHVSNDLLDTNETALWLWLDRLQEKSFQNEFENLKMKINELERELEIIKKGDEPLNRTSLVGNDIIHGLQSRLVENAINGDYQNPDRYFSNRKQEYADLFKYKWHDYDIANNMITPFSAFTTRDAAIFDIFPAEGQNQKGVPGEILHHNDLSEVSEYCLNGKPFAEHEKLNPEMVGGLYRTEPLHGSEYYMVYKHTGNTSVEIVNSRTILHVIRPFMKLEGVVIESVSTQREIVYAILPLDLTKMTRAQRFLNHFDGSLEKTGNNLHLTVVYFGISGLTQLKSMINQTLKRVDAKNVRVLELSGNYSWARGIHAGVRNLGVPSDNNDRLLLFLDVDILFNSDFLTRCRLHSQPGRKVYYPLAFGLYNPHVVYTLHKLDMPREDEQLNVERKESGSWREFSYTVSCQYLSDYIQVVEFKEEPVFRPLFTSSVTSQHGNGNGKSVKYGDANMSLFGDSETASATRWGLELYRQYVRSRMMVVRVPDPDLFHVWHQVKCDPTMDWPIFSSCIHHKAITEASNAQLGMLAFNLTSEMEETQV